MPSGTITQAQTYTDTLTGTYQYLSAGASSYPNQYRSRYTTSQPSSGTASVTNTDQNSSHTVTMTPNATGTYTFTVTERIERATYDSFSQFWYWQLTSTNTTSYTITVNADLPNADTSVSVTQTVTSGSSASATVSGSGGSGGTVNYLLKTSTSTPTTGDAGWQSSNLFSSLTRGTTYYGWTKRTSAGGAVVSTSSGSRTMGYNADNGGFILNPSNSGTTISIVGSPATFIVKLRSMSNLSEYFITGPGGSGTAKNWFTPTGNMLNSTGVNTSITFLGGGIYQLKSRRKTTTGGDTVSTIVDTIFVDALTGSISYGNVDATAGTVTPSISGNYSSVSFAKVSGTGTVNTTTGAVTYTHNEGSAARTTVVRATFTNPSNDTLDVDATSTQLGGSTVTLSYSNRNANSGTASPTIGGTYSSVSYSKISGSSAGTVNTTTGVVSWSDNLTISNRSITVRATVSRNGDTDTVDATSTQLGGPNVSYSYADAAASGGAYTPTSNHTGTVGTYVFTSQPSGATINSTTGAVTWPAREATSNSTGTVSVSVTRNGLTRSGTANITQLGGSQIVSFSYGTKDASAGTVVASASQTSTSLSFAIISGTGATVNASNGTLTWTHNESSSSRSVTVRMTASRNGDVDTSDAVATQQGGVSVSTFSYATKNAAAGAGSAPTYTTSPATGVTNGNFSISSGTGATINATTGVLTWTENSSSSSRTITVSRTSSRNGDSDTVSAIATQQGASSISVFTYANKNAAAGAGTAPSVTTSGGTNSFAVISGSGATVNSSTGVLTWTTNEGTSNRSVTVRLTNTRNGTSSTADATATQTRGLVISAFSYATKNASSGAGSAPTVTTNPASGTSRSFSLVSNGIGATINSTTGVITWPHNENTGSRTVTARLTASYNGDTDTNDYVATQQGGSSVSLSYGNRNATAGSVSPTVSGTYSSISYSKVSGSSAASINTSTGAVTWTNNTGTSNRSAVFRATVSRNGDTDTNDGTCTQLGGPGVSGSYAYANVLNAAGSYADPTSPPTFTGTAGNWSVSGTGASIIASGTNAGRVTFTANTSSSSRTATVYRTVTRNSYTRTLQVGTITQGGAPTGGNFALSADDATLDAGQNTVVRATASGLNAGSDYRNVLSITTSPSNPDNKVNQEITDVTDLTGNATTQYITTRTLNSPATITYNGTLKIYQLGPADSEGFREDFLIETRTASVNVGWSAIPTSDFSQNPVWTQANANNGATATLSTTAIANGTPQGSVSYARKDANQPFTVNSSTGTITWERNPGGSSRTGTVTVTGTNASFQPGGASYSQDFTVTQKAGPDVSFSYTPKDATAGSQPVTASHTGSATYSKVSGTGTVNSSTGAVTWTHNEGTSDRTTTVRATVTNNGDTRTGDVVATQYGGTSIVSFSYATKNATSGNVTPTIDVSPDSTLGFRITSGTGASVDEATGVLTWQARESGTDREVVVELTATKNGDSDVSTFTASQQGGVEVSFSYPSAGASGSTVSPVYSTLTSGATLEFSVLSGTGATVDNTTGDLTWDDWTEETDRTVTVRLTATRNGDEDIVDVVATQISQVVTASINGNNVANSNEYLTLNGVLSGLAQGVTAVSYTWSVVDGDIFSGQGTNQLTLHWPSIIINTNTTVNLTVTDSLSRSFAASTFTVAVTYVGTNDPDTGGTGSYNLEIRNAANEVILKANEVMTRRSAVGEVDASREVTLSNVDTTANVVVNIDLVGSGVYTVTSPTATSRTITFDPSVPVGTKYSLTQVR